MTRCAAVLALIAALAPSGPFDSSRTSLAPAFAKAAAGRQDKQGKATKGSPCDMIRIEDGQYCAKCDKVLVKTEKKSDFDKDGNCKNCGAAPEKVRVCVKDWVPACGMHDMRSHERGCCNSKFCCKHELVYSLVRHRCACGATGLAEGFDHKKADGCGKADPVCALSGTAPHGADCDLKTVEDGPWCADPACRTILDKTDMDKEGRCLKCKKKAQTVKVCVKADDGKTWRARIAITCRHCKMEGAEGGACTTKDCPRNGKPLERVCTDSGCWPHGGHPSKKD